MVSPTPSPNIDFLVLATELGLVADPMTATHPSGADGRPRDSIPLPLVGALGAQESGYMRLAALVGLPSRAGLALVLGKGTRDILLELPGLLCLHLSERAGGNAARAVMR